MADRSTADRSTDSPARGRLGLGALAACGVAAAVGGFWYLAMVGTQTQMLPVSLLLGWATAATLTRVAGRHGYAVAVYGIAIAMTALLVMLFLVQRHSLNFDPRNHIPVWANPTIVSDVFRVGFSHWPSHYAWLAASLLVTGWRAARGPHQPHPHVIRLYHPHRADALAAGERATTDRPTPDS